MLLIILVSVAFLVLLERTFLGAVQLRTRPIFVRLYGVIQTVVDRVKLLNKGIRLNNFYARLFLGRVLIFLTLSNLIALSFYLIAGIIVMYQGILVSNNIYSKIGRYRMILLSWRYDLVIILLLLLIPMLIILPMIYYILSSEVRRTPVDLVEGESELVSRYNTEYAGREFVRFFLREYIILFLLLVYFIILYIPFLILWVIVAKLIRRSFPRYKYREVLVVI